MGFFKIPIILQYFHPLIFNFKFPEIQCYILTYIETVNRLIENNLSCASMYGTVQYNYAGFLNLFLFKFFYILFSLSKVSCFAGQQLLAYV
jgi:hypothetical protein